MPTIVFQLYRSPRDLIVDVSSYHHLLYHRYFTVLTAVNWHDRKPEFRQYPSIGVGVSPKIIAGHLNHRQQGNEYDVGTKISEVWWVVGAMSWL